MICPKCKAEITDQATFCPKCGVNVNGSNLFDLHIKKTPKEAIKLYFLMLAFYGIIILFLVAILMIFKIIDPLSQADIQKTIEVGFIVNPVIALFLGVLILHKKNLHKNVKAVLLLFASLFCAYAFGAIGGLFILIYMTTLDSCDNNCV